MARFQEGPIGTERESNPGLPFAGHPVTDQDSLLDFYFGHPTSTGKGQAPPYAYGGGFVPSKFNHERAR